MHKFLLMLVAGFGILIADTTVNTADAQSCRELRRLCLNVRGEGNCERYRNSGCPERREDRIRDRLGGGGMSPRCERLQRACDMKDRLGEQGQGNCRRFRDECGGRR